MPWALAGSVLVVGLATAISPIAGAAAVLAVAAAAVIFFHPVVGGVLLLAVVPAVSGLSRGLLVPGFRVSEVLIVGISTLVLATAPRVATRRWRAFDWLALAYVVATFGLGLFDIARRGDPLTTEALGTLLGPLQFFLAYRAVLVAVGGENGRRMALRWMLWLSVPVSVLGLLQQADVLGVRPFLEKIIGHPDLTTVFSYEAINRATGPFPHWHMLGGYLLIVMLVGVAVLVRGRSDVISRRWLAGILIVDGAALAATVSIAPVTALLVGVLVLAFTSRKLTRTLAVLAAVFVVAGIAFAPMIQERYEGQFRASSTAVNTAPAGMPQTIGYRYAVWRDQYIPALRGNWLTGYGPVLPPAITWKYTESMYVTLFLRGGIVLFAVYAGLMWALFRAARRVSREPGSPASLSSITGQVLALGVVLLVPLHLIMPYFVDTGLPHVLWALAGLALAPAAQKMRPTAP